MKRLMLSVFAILAACGVAQAQTFPSKPITVVIPLAAGGAVDTMVRTMLESMLVTGFPYNVHEEADQFVKVFAQVLKHARAIRRLGSAAIDICWVAAGRMDGFWEAVLKPWDTRAAALILEEAGGRVTAMNGGRWDPYAGDIVATNGLIHEEVLRLIS